MIKKIKKLIVRGVALIMEGYKKAIELLYEASTPNGFVAAVQEEDNYRRIWTRDSSLCGLAALSTDDAPLKQTFKKSIESIFINQHEAGFIPSNVSPVGKSVSYGNVVGRVDNHAWIIISACNYAHVQKEKQWLQQFETAVAKSISLMTAWEFNGRGLMYVPQSADWADEYYHHGYILYNQLLRLWALRCAASAFNNEYYRSESVRVQTAIEKYFGGKEVYAAQIKRMQGGLQFPYWIMGFNTSAIYTQFDLQANALILLLNIGSEEQRKNLVGYVNELCTEQSFMLPSFHPVINEDAAAMHDLKNNYAYRFRNLPYEFHNGGLWSVWNGLMSMCIARQDEDLAAKISNNIDIACAQNNWEFNECHHGKTHQPIGIPKCAWSAAGLILGKNHFFLPQLISE
ncbi:MAG: hypothetical protein M3352_00185 [Bacteroidota bacterium]|nr:hypothetical protein [Bacteroidota bacterium]